MLRILILIPVRNAVGSLQDDAPISTVMILQASSMSRFDRMCSQNQIFLPIFSTQS